MASFYQKFKALGLDLAPLGLEDRGTEGSYFCTPVGARCIGRPGVDGIHFCFICGHREMVFAAICFTRPGELKKIVAVSSLYFGLPGTTVWRMLFYEPRQPERQVEVWL